MEDIVKRVTEEVIVQDGYLNLKSWALQRDVLYILCPYGIGDTLYVASLIKGYKEYHNETRKVCLILKESHSVIADWFTGIDMKLVSNEIVEILNVYAILTQTWKLDNFVYGHFKKSEKHRLYSDYHFTAEKDVISRYKKLVLQMPYECYMEPMKVQDLQNSEVLEKYKIDKKTIIIMPYACSTPLLPTVFWETLVQILSKLGYRILTNVKDSTEPVVEGTEEISENLEVMARVCEESLMVIALRSGICDVLALTNTLLVMVYTREDYYREWDVQTVIDRDGIMSLLCDNTQDVMGVMKEILSLFDVYI